MSKAFTAVDMERWLEIWAKEFGGDWDLQTAIAHDSWWEATLRLSLRPNNPDGPDESVVFYSSGHSSSTEGFRECFEAAKAWWRRQRVVSHESTESSSSQIAGDTGNGVGEGSA